MASPIDCRSSSAPRWSWNCRPLNRRTCGFRRDDEDALGRRRRVRRIHHLCRKVVGPSRRGCLRNRAGRERQPWRQGPGDRKRAWLFAGPVVVYERRVRYSNIAGLRPRATMGPDPIGGTGVGASAHCASPIVAVIAINIAQKATRLNTGRELPTLRVILSFTFLLPFRCYLQSSMCANNRPNAYGIAPLRTKPR